MRQFILFTLFLALLLGVATYYSKTHPTKPREFIELYGNIDVRQVELGFQVEGRVKTMLFQEGDFVKKGQKMADLDPTIYFDQVRQATANAESAKYSLSHAETLLKRRNELISDGSISQEDYDNALSSRDVYTANLKAASAALKIAQTNMGYTKLFAPVDGTLLTRIREPGTVVRASDPIYTLSIQDPVWVRAFVSEPDVGLVYPGMPAHIYTDTPGGKVYQGHVGFVSPVSEFTPKTVETTQLRTTLVYRLRVIADNPDLGLRQGMPVTVKLFLQPQETLENHP